MKKNVNENGYFVTIQKRIFAPVFLAMALFTLLLRPPADAMELNDIVQKLQLTYRNMVDYKADFIQETRIKAYPRAQKASGKVFFKKPGKMRWNYLKPEKKEIVTDGDIVWMYTPALDQVIKTTYAATNQSKVARVFLSGMGEFTDNFHITLHKSDPKQSEVTLELIPKDESEALKSILLTVDTNSFNVKKSVMTDIYENVTSVSFARLIMNSGVKNEIFDFTPPEGIDIVTPQMMNPAVK